MKKKIILGTSFLIVIFSVLYFFYTKLNYEKNFSKYTVKNYNIDINKFLNYLKTKEITKLNEINNETIQMYIISLNNDGLNPNSVSRIKSSVCSFIKFLYKKKYIPKDPIIKLTVPKKQKKLPHVLSIEQNWIKPGASVHMYVKVPENFKYEND